MASVIRASNPRHDLDALLVVHLIPVVLRRVVAGSDDDPRRRFQFPHRKGQLGRRAERAEHVGLDAVAVNTAAVSSANSSER